ncbi:hypothetical protein [Vibrio sp. Vb339]|uniref:hypothetical protein n=1 Tax=Vibrio sp. Vb339 TaxID=1192013 RepID=UPI001555AF43|nr:hypothetical protein [Vibrio sp. Vb339]
MIFYVGKVASGHNQVRQSDDKYMAIKNEDVFNESDGVVNGYNKQQALFKTAFTKKHRDWAYEQEVRLLCDDSGVIYFAPEALESVIFGMRISNQDKATVNTLLTLPKWNHEKTYQASPHELELALNIDEVSRGQ